MLGQRLQTMRESVGLSIYALGRQAVVGVATISEIESGKNLNPGIVTLAKLADVLGCSLDYLAGRTDVWRIATRPRPRHTAPVS